MRFFEPYAHVITAQNVKRVVLFGCLPALVFYPLSLVIMTQSGFNALEAIRDTAQLTKQSSFLGFLSSIGAWLWLSAAVLCFFRVAVYAKNDKSAHKRLLGLTGGFSLFLAVDDFFLIHDRYIAEGILIPIYGGFFIWMLLKYRQKIIEIDGFAFLMAGGLLFMSIAVDAVQEILPLSYVHNQIIEEGFKFVGAAAWMYYCYRLAAFGISQRH